MRYAILVTARPGAGEIRECFRGAAVITAPTRPDLRRLRPHLALVNACRSRRIVAIVAPGRMIEVYDAVAIR